jgi:plastocyanin
MTHHGARTLIPTLVAGLALAAGAAAQPVQNEQVGIAFTGKLTAVDANAKTLTVRGAHGEYGVFHVDEEDTTIMSGSEKVALSGLHEGEWISIDADMRGSRKVATYVEVVEDPTAGGGSGRALPSPDGATIEVRHNDLSPALVQISAGQTVTFQNIDKMPGGHTVVAADGSFSSPALDQGETWSHTFDVPGVYPIRIKEHPGAEARVVVE